MWLSIKLWYFLEFDDSIIFMSHLIIGTSFHGELLKIPKSLPEHLGSSLQKLLAVKHQLETCEQRGEFRSLLHVGWCDRFKKFPFCLKIPGEKSSLPPWYNHSSWCAHVWCNPCSYTIFSEKQNLSRTVALIWNAKSETTHFLKTLENLNPAQDFDI